MRLTTQSNFASTATDMWTMSAATHDLHNTCNIEAWQCQVVPTLAKVCWRMTQAAGKLVKNRKLCMVSYQQLQEVEAVVCRGADKRRLQEALLDDWMPTELVQQGQGGASHPHEAPSGAALPLMECLFVCSIPACSHCVLGGLQQLERLPYTSSIRQ